MQVYVVFETKLARVCEIELALSFEHRLKGFFRSDTTIASICAHCFAFNNSFGQVLNGVLNLTFSVPLHRLASL